MALNVLVVDDSHFFQKVLSEIIDEHPQLNVIDVANNGREAVDKVKSLQPDIVTMDYEMPMMDGVSAVRTIMDSNPLPILMLSSMTYAGAKITIDALEAGAAEFMTKNFAEISSKNTAVKKRLCNIILELGKNIKIKRQNSTVMANKTILQSKPKSAVEKTIFASAKKPKIIAIGSSTGGPVAVTELLKNIPKSFPCPIVVIQHMPENFTRAFAERLDKQCSLTVKEAEDGDILSAGRVLIAPGGKQMLIDKSNKQKVCVKESTDAINYKPSVDICLASLSNAYGGDALAIVLTGMGSDGCDGARLLREKQATIWTQEKESCVVYGMPMAIDQANLSNASLSIKGMEQHLCAL